jgi:protein-disulfide isomerase-like protein with CxxC motif
MARRFEMDPQGTATGLSTAGETRASAAASGIPALPLGNYVDGYSAAATAVLATLGAELTGTIGTGLANTATTAASTETTEAANQASLTT